MPQGEVVNPVLDLVEQTEYTMAVVEVMSVYPWFAGMVFWQYQPQSSPWSENPIVPGDMRDLTVANAVRIAYRIPQ